MEVFAFHSLVSIPQNTNSGFSSDVAFGITYFLAPLALVLLARAVQEDVVSRLLLAASCQFPVLYFATGLTLQDPFWRSCLVLVTLVQTYNVIEFVGSENKNCGSISLEHVLSFWVPFKIQSNVTNKFVVAAPSARLDALRRMGGAIVLHYALHHLSHAPHIGSLLAGWCPAASPLVSAVVIVLRAQQMSDFFCGGIALVLGPTATVSPMMSWPLLAASPLVFLRRCLPVARRAVKLAVFKRIDPENHYAEAMVAVFLVHAALLEWASYILLGSGHAGEISLLFFGAFAIAWFEHAVKHCRVQMRLVDLLEKHGLLRSIMPWAAMWVVFFMLCGLGFELLAT